MQKRLLAHQLVEASKVFAYKGELYFKRIAPTTAVAPLYNTGHYFDLSCNGLSLKFHPISFTLRSVQPIISIRDLLDRECLLERAFFTCYYDPYLLIEDVKIVTKITLESAGISYLLNCKVYTPKYEMFYDYLLPGAQRRHVTVRVENVTVAPSIIIKNKAP
jgi:hypothetical protein